MLPNIFMLLLFSPASFRKFNKTIYKKVKNLLKNPCSKRESSAHFMRLENHWLMINSCTRLTQQNNFWNIPAAIQKEDKQQDFFIFNSYILQTKTDQKYRFPSFQILKATASKLQNNEKITESSVNFFLFSTYRRESGAEMSLTYGAGAQLCQ